MQLNGVSIVDRSNRPSVTSKVGLRVFFINNGTYFDPTDISGVTIFKRLANLTPSGVIEGSNGLIASSVASGTVLMHYGASANDAGAALDATSYNPSTDASSLSGIYRVSVGEYVVVLDGTQDSSGFYDINGSSLEVRNGASAVDDYIDVWTVKHSANSDYTTLINNFSLVDDTFFVLTEPVIWKTHTKLKNSNFPLDTKENIVVFTDLSIANRGIDPTLKNVLKDSTITNPQFLIEKINESDTSLGSRIEVSGFSDTSALIDVTEDNTLLLLWDTAQLKTHAKTANGTLGAITGTYSLTVKFTLLTETIVTKPMFFTVS